MSSAHFIPVLVTGLIAWRVYRRIRRNIGRQPLHPRRALVSIVILSLVSILILGFSWPKWHLLSSLGGGILAGAALGFLGMRLTKFETTAAGHFYLPNTHIGVALSLLFVGRIVYRLFALNDAAYAVNQPQAFQSPLTLFILGLTVGYYLVYQTGLLLHSRDQKISGQNDFASGSADLDSSRDRS
jgi:hypothetical protein